MLQAIKQDDKKDQVNIALRLSYSTIHPKTSGNSPRLCRAMGFVRPESKLVPIRP